VNAKNPINPKNPTNSIRLPGCQKLGGKKIVTWSNTIIDYSRKIQKAEKGKLPEKVGREAMGLFVGSQVAEEKGGHKW